MAWLRPVALAFGAGSHGKGHLANLAKDIDLPLFASSNPTLPPVEFAPRRPCGVAWDAVTFGSPPATPGPADHTAPPAGTGHQSVWQSVSCMLYLEGTLLCNCAGP